ncbi:MAG: AzlC family ABC transporter permease [Sneathiellales bacterium]|nr:AzlC family ABC transporter permease [Sneathiellales bacterium]
MKNHTANEVQASAITEYFDGIRDAAPVLVAVVPFSILFGAIALDKGLSFAEMLLASLSIYAVASQYVMLDLMGQKLPVWLIVLSVFALNFRHVLYSAAIGRKLSHFTGFEKTIAFFLLVDPQYAAAEARSLIKKLTPAYYFSYAATVYTTWVLTNCIGGLFGKLIENPEIYGLDFILPLYFTALVVGFRSTSGFLWVASGSSVISLLIFFTIGSPWHISIGGLAGLAIAATLSRPEETSHG